MDKMGKTDKSHKTNKTEVWSPERKDMKVGMFFYGGGISKSVVHAIWAAY